jgi:hypothetical protein
MTLQEDITKAKRKFAGFKENWFAMGPIGAMFQFFNGRCTFFAICFSIVGIILAFMGKLSAEYVALVGAIQTLLVAHSVKEDVNDIRQASVRVTVNNVQEDTKQ